MDTRRNFIAKLGGIIAGSFASPSLPAGPAPSLAPGLVAEGSEALGDIDFDRLLMELMSARLCDDWECQILGVPPLPSDRWMEVRGEGIIEAVSKGLTVECKPLAYDVLCHE